MLDLVRWRYMSTLLVAGGQVLTPAMTVERADVLVDQDTGRILEVGPDVGSAESRLDAEGCLVMPGLVNAHTHVAMTLLRGYSDDKPVDAWLEEDIWPVEAALTPEDIQAGAELGMLEMIKSGTTAFCDMYFEMDRIAAAVESAGVRARLGYGMITAGKDEEATREELATGLTVAETLDGDAGGRVQVGYMPHSLTTVDLDALESPLAAVRHAGYPVHYHANESPAFVDPIVEEHGERPLVYADDHGLLEPGDFVAHGVHLVSEEIELLVERDVGVVHCPASNMKLASGMAPVERMRSAGVSVGLGTDGAASNNDLDLFDELRDAAMVGKVATGDPEAVPAEAAVRMATAEGADVIGIETGRIAEGWPADLAILDLSGPHLQPQHDLVSHLAYAAKGSDVRHTVCDGRVLMRDRECLTLDEEAVIARAKTAASDLFARVGN